jgi:hypothetical protein
MQLIDPADAAPEVRAVLDDIKQTRQTDRVNNFWLALASHPATLERTWESVKQVMAPGALDPLTKELVYVAVSDGGAARRAPGSRRHGQRDERTGNGVRRPGRRRVQARPVGGARDGALVARVREARPFPCR